MDMSASERGLLNFGGKSFSSLRASPVFPLHDGEFPHLPQLYIQIVVGGYFLIVQFLASLRVSD